MRRTRRTKLYGYEIPGRSVGRLFCWVLWVLTAGKIPRDDISTGDGSALGAHAGGFYAFYWLHSHSGDM